MTKLEYVLSSTEPVPPGVRCWHCMDDAVVQWPVCPAERQNKPIPLCQRHLELCRERLVIALGGQGELSVRFGQQL